MNVPARRIFALLALAASVTALEGCRKKPQPVTTPSTGTPGPSIDDIARRNAEREDSIRAAGLRDSLEAARADSIRNATGGDAMVNLREALLAPVQFEFDMSELRMDARSSLETKAAILNANPDVRVRIGGHTDERGSDEYNLALGQRRAAAAKDYLVSLGVSAARLETITWGEQRPLCGETDESCWTRNRRAEFQITAGGTNLRRP